LPFLMLSDSFTEHSIKHSKGSVNPYINWKDIANYEFLLPPLVEQKKINEVLWGVENSIIKLEIYLQKLRSFQDKIITNLLKPKKGGKLTKFGEIIKLSKEKSQAPYGNLKYLGLEHIDSGVSICNKFIFFPNETGLANTLLYAHARR